jgi:hypothetical protein
VRVISVISVVSLPKGKRECDIYAFQGGHSGVRAMPVEGDAIRLWPDWGTSGAENARVPWIQRHLWLLPMDGGLFSRCGYLYRFNSEWLSLRKRGIHRISLSASKTRGIRDETELTPSPRWLILASLIEDDPRAVGAALNGSSPQLACDKLRGESTTSVRVVDLRPHRASHGDACTYRLTSL